MDKIKAKKIVGYTLTSMLVGCLIIAFCVLSAYIGKTQFKIDSAFIYFSSQIKADWLTVIFKIISNLVNPIFIGLVGFVILLSCKKQRPNTVAMFINIAIIVCANYLLKSFFVRVRPDAGLAIMQEVGYSYPSGHSSAAVAFYGFLVYMVCCTSLKKWAKACLSVLLSLMVLLVGFSRIYLGVHYATDVIGAYLYSLAFLIVFCFILSRLKRGSKLEQQNVYKSHSVLAGFKYAISGIITAFKTETNLLIQLCAGLLMVVFGVTLKISLVEWCICVSMCFLVLALELVNTAIENLCDKINPQTDPKIKIIKDVSAGAVLLISICSVVIALILFIPKLQMLFV